MVETNQAIGIHLFCAISTRDSIYRPSSPSMTLCTSSSSRRYEYRPLHVCFEELVRGEISVLPGVFCTCKYPSTPSSFYFIQSRTCPPRALRSRLSIPYSFVASGDYHDAESSGTKLDTDPATIPLRTPPTSPANGTTDRNYWNYLRMSAITLFKLFGHLKSCTGGGVVTVTVFLFLPCQLLYRPWRGNEILDLPTGNMVSCDTALSVLFVNAAASLWDGEGWVRDMELHFGIWKPGVEYGISASDLQSHDKSKFTPHLTTLAWSQQKWITASPR